MSGKSCELLSPALKSLCKIPNSLFFNVQIRMQINFWFFSQYYEKDNFKI